MFTGLLLFKMYTVFRYENTDLWTIYGQDLFMHYYGIMQLQSHQKLSDRNPS